VETVDLPQVIFFLANPATRLKRCSGAQQLRWEGLTSRVEHFTFQLLQFTCYPGARSLVARGRESYNEKQQVSIRFEVVLLESRNGGARCDSC
jgi:hypothetical protein